MKRALAVLVAVGTIGGCGRGSDDAGAAAQNLDPVALGARKARACVGCHGPQGNSRVSSYPSLAGLDRQYLAEQLHAFKSGARENPMMNAMATNLSAEDIEHLAAYFAAQTASGQ